MQSLRRAMEPMLLALKALRVAADQLRAGGDEAGAVLIEKRIEAHGIAIEKMCTEWIEKRHLSEDPQAVPPGFECEDPTVHMAS